MCRGLNLTIIQIIKQLKRSYSRRLNVEIDFYEYYFNARHAYSSIGLAVKTSRPHKFSKSRTAKLQNLSFYRSQVDCLKNSAKVHLRNRLNPNILRQILYHTNKAAILSDSALKMSLLNEVCPNKRT